MGNVADFSKYKARKDYHQKLLTKGWMPTRLEADAVGGVSIYIYDDHTRLLLFSLIQQSSLEQISRRVRHSDQTNLLNLAEQLSALISDFSRHPPFQGDQRLSAMAQAAAWFAGFSLSLINGRSLQGESIVIFRLVDVENGESAFHLAHLEWPEVMERSRAESQLSGMARTLRRSLFGQA